MKIVRDFDDLVGLESSTHYIEFWEEDESYWVMSKEKGCKVCGDSGYYLSTHSFYPSYVHNTRKIFDVCGFNIKIEL